MAQSWTKTKDKLLEAARKCDAKTIASIVTSGKVDVNVTDKAGCTAVHVCCKSADLESLGTLLEHGARTDIFDNTGMAPLHHAAVKDYVETMALLVSYGADVDVQNTSTKMTPLHYATVNKRTRASNFMLFCGADPDVKDKVRVIELEKHYVDDPLATDVTNMLKDGRVAMTGLTPDQFDSHTVIRRAYKESHIQIGGKMVKRNEKHTFKHGLKINNVGKNCTSFSFLCRKMLINYMQVDGATTPRRHLERDLVGESGEIISDVYDYLVNVSASGVGLTVPVYARPTKFDDMVLRNNAGQEFRCAECVENQTGIFCSFNVTLTANEDNTNTFAVVMKRQKNTAMATGEAQTIRSSVDPKFGLHIPDKSLSKNTSVELQMMPVADLSDGMNTEFIVGMSNLCTVTVNNKPRRALTVTLPLPDTVTECDEETNNAVFLTNEETQTPTEWKEVDSCMKDDNSMEVTDPNVVNGTCVVLKVHKERKKDFVERVVEFLKWLYRSAFCRLKPCCFFGMSRFRSPEDKCEIIVGIVDSKPADDAINKWRKDKFLTSLSQKTSTHLIKPNSHFIVQVIDESRVRGLSVSKQCLVYQYGRESRGDFMVSGKEHDFVSFVIHQVSKEWNIHGVEALDQSTSKLTTQVNVELQREGNTSTSKEYNSPLQNTEYPDSRFLSWMSGELGHEWMMVGIGLGQKFSYLETIEGANVSVQRAIRTLMYTWREENEKERDLGLTMLIHSLARVGRRDLVAEIDTRVRKRIAAKPDERLSRWVASLTRGRDQVDAGPVATGPEHGVTISCLIEQEKAVSPFSEAFLLTVVSATGSSPQLLGQLNLPKSTVDGIYQAVQDPVSAMFKCLLTARRRYDDVVGFFADLLVALDTDRNQEAICKIKQEIRAWLKMNATNSDGRRLDSMLQKY